MDIKKRVNLFFWIIGGFMTLVFTVVISINFYDQTQTEWVLIKLLIELIQQKKNQKLAEMSIEDLEKMLQQ
jgi:hypothetical protein